MIFQFDFANLFLAMRNAGYSVLGFFANFGTYFTEPFWASYVRVTFPTLYLLLNPIVQTLEKSLTSIIGADLTHFFLGPSLLDMMGIGIVLCVFANIFKKIWQLIPFA